MLSRSNSKLSVDEIPNCGASFCPAQLLVDHNKTTANKNFETDITRIYLMAGIYLACSITAAILIACFVDPLKRYTPSLEILTFCGFLGARAPLDLTRVKKKKSKRRKKF